MILDKNNKPEKRIEIDLTGPDGNAFVLMKWAEVLGYQLGYSRNRVAAIRKVMMMGDYEGLVKVFDREFGDFVTLWR
jgi:hypothetical protein